MVTGDPECGCSRYSTSAKLRAPVGSLTGAQWGGSHQSPFARVLLPLATHHRELSVVETPCGTEGNAFVQLCPRYCLVCHQQLQEDLDALKPYVCSSKLCTYQYYNLNRGPSLEVRIFLSVPTRVDPLLVRNSRQSYHRRSSGLAGVHRRC